MILVQVLHGIGAVLGPQAARCSIVDKAILGAGQDMRRGFIHADIGWVRYVRRRHIERDARLDTLGRLLYGALGEQVAVEVLGVATVSLHSGEGIEHRGPASLIKGAFAGDQSTEAQHVVGAGRGPISHPHHVLDPEVPWRLDLPFLRVRAEQVQLLVKLYRGGQGRLELGQIASHSIPAAEERVLTLGCWRQDIVDHLFAVIVVLDELIPLVRFFRPRQRRLLWWRGFASARRDDLDAVRWFPCAGVTLDGKHPAGDDSGLGLGWRQQFAAGWRRWGRRLGTFGRGLAGFGSFDLLVGLGLTLSHRVEHRRHTLAIRIGGRQHFLAHGDILCCNLTNLDRPKPGVHVDVREVLGDEIARRLGDDTIGGAFERCCRPEPDRQSGADDLFIPVWNSAVERGSSSCSCFRKAYQASRLPRYRRSRRAEHRRRGFLHCTTKRTDYRAAYSPRRSRLGSVPDDVGHVCPNVAPGEWAALGPIHIHEGRAHGGRQSRSTRTHTDIRAYRRTTRRPGRTTNCADTRASRSTNRGAQGTTDDLEGKIAHFLTSRRHNLLEQSGVFDRLHSRRVDQ